MRTLVATSKRSVHNLGQISNQLSESEPEAVIFQNLRFGEGVNFDDWQAGCADLKEVRMIVYQYKPFWEVKKILHEMFFIWGHLIHCPHYLIWNVMWNIITFRNDVFQFSNQCSKISYLSEREIKQVPRKIFWKGPILTV